MNDIYKLYNFKYVKKEAIQAFKQALIDKGIDDKNKFVEFVLKSFPDKSKSTVEDYYARNDRLCTDSDILTLIHKELNISLQDIFLPNSQCKFNDHLLQIKAGDSFSTIVSISENVVDVLYNCNEINSKSTAEELNDYYNELISVLKIYAYYNYLIQKYAYSYLSSYERYFLESFSNLLTFSRTDLFTYIKGNITKPNVFSSFYIDNTLAAIVTKKHYLLDYYKVFDLFDGDRLIDVLSIIPPRERNVLCFIYSKTNNEKIKKALDALGARPKRIEYDGDINDSNIGEVLETLVDKGVLVHA